MSPSHAGNLSPQKESDTVSIHEHGTGSHKDGNGVIPKPPTRTGTDQLSLSTEAEIEAQELNEDSLHDVFDQPLERPSRLSKPSTPPKPSKPSKLSAPGASRHDVSLHNALPARPLGERTPQPANDGRGPQSRMRKILGSTEHLSSTPDSITRVYLSSLTTPFTPANRLLGKYTRSILEKCSRQNHLQQ